MPPIVPTLIRFCKATFVGGRGDIWHPFRVHGLFPTSLMVHTHPGIMLSRRRLDVSRTYILSACRVHSTHAASACSVHTRTHNVRAPCVVSASFWSARVPGIKGCTQSTQHDSEPPQSGCSNLFRWKLLLFQQGVIISRQGIARGRVGKGRRRKMKKGGQRRRRQRQCWERKRPGRERETWLQPKQLKQQPTMRWRNLKGMSWRVIQSAQCPSARGRGEWCRQHGVHRGRGGTWFLTTFLPSMRPPLWSSTWRRIASTTRAVTISLTPSTRSSRCGTWLRSCDVMLRSYSNILKTSSVEFVTSTVLSWSCTCHQELWSDSDLCN